MSFRPGDRVRCSTTGPDGLPLVRYGFVGSVHDDEATVMFDGDLKGDDTVPLDALRPVTITGIELRLTGVDLLDDPSLRQGLVSLWSAEADEAGLEINHMSLLGTGVLSPSGFTLAALQSGGTEYLLHAGVESPTDTVWVRANPFD